MGLLLSILVSCVGVVELIAFYAHLRRSLRLANPENGNIETVTYNYKKMLSKNYRQIFAEVNGKEVHKGVATNFTLSTSPKVVFHSEENGHAFNVKTSENHVSDKNHIFKTETLNIASVPEEVEMSHINNKSYCLKDISNTTLPPVERSAPRNDHLSYLLTHSDTNLETIPIEMNSPNFLHERNYIITETVFNGSQTEIDIIPDSEYESPHLEVERIYFVEEFLDDPVHGERCPSPFPYEMFPPRSNMCSELLTNPIASVIEVEEDADMEFGMYQPLYLDNHSDNKVLDLRRNRSVSPHRSPCEGDITTYLPKRRRSKSSSDLDYQLVVGDYWQRSPSLFEQLLNDNIERQNRQFVLVEEIFSDDFKNSLDGVKTKNPNEERKREFKRKRNNRNRLSQTSLDGQSNSDSKENLQLVLQENVLEQLTSGFNSAKINEEVVLPTAPVSSLCSADIVSEQCSEGKIVAEKKITPATSINSSSNTDITSKEHLTLNDTNIVEKVLNISSVNSVSAADTISKDTNIAEEQCVQINNTSNNNSSQNLEQNVEVLESTTDRENLKINIEVPLLSRTTTNSTLIESSNQKVENNMQDQSLSSNVFLDEETRLESVEVNKSDGHDQHEIKEELTTSDSSSNSSTNNTVILKESPSQKNAAVSEQQPVAEPSTSSDIVSQHKGIEIPKPGSSKNQEKPEAFWVN